MLCKLFRDADPARSRVNPVANLKIKNNLLAIVLILTSLPRNVKVSRALVEQIAFDIGRLLDAGSERPEVSRSPPLDAFAELAARHHSCALRNNPFNCLVATASYCLWTVIRAFSGPPAHHRPSHPASNQLRL